MHQSKRGLESGVTEVRVERLQLEGGDHPFIHECPAGQGGEVGTKLTLSAFAQPERLTVQVDAGEGLPFCIRLLRRNKQLFKEGHCFQGQFANFFRLRWHHTPPQNLETLLGGKSLNGRFFSGPGCSISGQETGAYRIKTFFGELKIAHFNKKTMRDLRDNPRTITGASIGPDRSPVFQVAKRFQRFLHNVVAWCASERGHHGQPTSVPIVRRVIQPSSLWSRVPPVKWRCCGHSHRPRRV